MMPTADGRWHVGDPARHFWDRRVYRNITRTHCWAARVFRCVDGKWEQDECMHNHTTPGVAKRCAEKLARRFNREDA
jgi:hypothetical protein